MGPGPPRRHGSRTGSLGSAVACLGHLQRGRQQLPQTGTVDGLLEAVRYGGTRLGEEHRAVGFPQLRPDGPGQLLPAETELRVDAGLVAPRVP
ncbi:hypothetical protein GKJPGBOP_07057 [Streptomyces paromomycinus]|uniref:Uncharacterized protein n=1 Tax=Streptomyces paromomycinus TaxID=92743 RepID=A0A401WDC9_STREY|nr:hypothetical protein GKJPGBOP_07057 [Streptomyces paromomycinus]